jgi:hypothetical protein
MTATHREVFVLTRWEEYTSQDVVGVFLTDMEAAVTAGIRAIKAGRLDSGITFDVRTILTDALAPLSAPLVVIRRTEEGVEIERSKG